MIFLKNKSCVKAILLWKYFEKNKLFVVRCGYLVRRTGGLFLLLLNQVPSSPSSLNKWFIIFVEISWKCRYRWLLDNQNNPISFMSVPIVIARASIRSKRPCSSLSRSCELKVVWVAVFRSEKDLVRSKSNWSLLNWKWVGWPFSGGFS